MAIAIRQTTFGHSMTGNPTLSANTFTETGRVVPGEAMTVQGTVNKTAILLLLTTLAASYTWHLFWQGEVAAANAWLMGGAIGGFVIALVTTFKKTWSPVTAPLYALLQGWFVGGLACLG